MKVSQVLGIGANLILLFVCVGLVVGNFGLRTKPYYYISLPQGVLLCTAGKTLDNGWRTIACLPVDISNQVSDTPSTRHFLPPTMARTY